MEDSITEKQNSLRWANTFVASIVMEQRQKAVHMRNMIDSLEVIKKKSLLRYLRLMVQKVQPRRRMNSARYEKAAKEKSNSWNNARRRYSRRAC